MEDQTRVLICLRAKNQQLILMRWNKLILSRWFFLSERRVNNGVMLVKLCDLYPVFFVDFQFDIKNKKNKKNLGIGGGSGTRMLFVCLAWLCLSFLLISTGYSSTQRVPL